MGSGSGGGSGATCLASYDFAVVAGWTYTIGTCATFTGDTYLRVTGACACSNDDGCGVARGERASSWLVQGPIVAKLTKGG